MALCCTCRDPRLQRPQEPRLIFYFLKKKKHDLFPLKAKIFSVDAKLQRRVIWLMKE